MCFFFFFPFVMFERFVFFSKCIFTENCCHIWSFSTVERDYFFPAIFGFILISSAIQLEFRFEMVKLEGDEKEGRWRHFVENLNQNLLKMIWMWPKFLLSLCKEWKEEKKWNQINQITQSPMSTMTQQQNNNFLNEREK